MALPLCSTLRNCKHSFWWQLCLCSFLSVAVWCHILCSLPAVTCGRLIICTLSPFRDAGLYLCSWSAARSLFVVSALGTVLPSPPGGEPSAASLLPSLSVNFKSFSSCPFILLWAPCTPIHLVIVWPFLFVFLFVLCNCSFLLPNCFTAVLCGFLLVVQEAWGFFANRCLP